MPAVPGGRPARPAGRHPGPAASTPGNGEGAHEVTARDHPAPGPAGLPLRQGRAARQPAPPRSAARGAFPLSPFPGPAAPGSRLPPPARRGPDLTRRAERSVRRRGPTDGPPPGTPTAPGRPPATPDEDPGTPGDPLLTIEEVTAELRVSRAAFYRWRRQEPARQRCGCRAAGCGSGAARSRRGCAAWKNRTRKTDRSRQQMDSYDVRFWDIKKLGNGTGARFRVRWAVDGREHCKSFKARPLADGFLDGLKDAVRDRRPFDPRTGLPEAETTGDEMVTWYAARPRLRRGQVGRTSPRSRAGRSPRPWSPSPSPFPRRSRARPRRRCCGRRCSPGRSTPPPATATRRRRSPPPSTGPSAPPCRSPSWRTPRPCGSRSARAPRP